MSSNLFNISQYMRSHKLGSFNILKESDERFEDTDTPDSAADVGSWVPSFDDKNIKGWTAQYEQ